MNDRLQTKSGKKYRIKISTPFPKWPLERQTQGGKGVWENCEFYINQEIHECDFWVVYDNLLAEESVFCPPENVILITGEPPSLQRYESTYINQFGAVITCHRDLKHANLIFMQQAQPWHVGRRHRDGQELGFSKDYDDLSALREIKKDRLISVISSNKQTTPGHRKRLQFVRALGEHFGNRIDIFGRGIYEIDDKWDAIARYKYHIVLENSAYPDYWTEKLADAYLGGAFPIYYGCPNLVDYFSASAFYPIELDDRDVITKIEQLVNSSCFDQSLPELWTAREQVLNEYNLFAMLCILCNRLPESLVKKHISLMPMSPKRTSYFGNVLKKLKLLSK